MRETSPINFSIQVHLQRNELNFAKYEVSLSGLSTRVLSDTGVEASPQEKKFRGSFHLKDMEINRKFSN